VWLARPPQEAGEFLPSGLTDLMKLDSRFKFEIRYATADNFLNTPVYTSARAFLQRHAALALLRAHRELMKQGHGLLIFDGWWCPLQIDGRFVLTHYLPHDLPTRAAVNAIRREPRPTAGPLCEFHLRTPGARRAPLSSASETFARDGSGLR